MATRRPRKVDSELECFVLGLCWQLGPCSPYELRTHMARSPSRQWSGSAGAIYPLVRRLESRGLLASKATGSPRERRDYRITAAGRRALRRWIGPPIPEAAVTVSYDPLRGRARFLALLAPAERVAWLADARRVLDEVEAQVRAWDETLARRDDAIAATLTASGEHDVAGRRRWLAFLEHSAGRLPPAAG